ncbi:hypothetical protein [Tabrizicola sp. TH137]|uniref:hypothetical protein n=1 Tax=Tabrizicola sp. TH137 TaxID=2067452 RepID=UPI00117E5E4D|nr:hypothetical protein [Tabrizicola sp. TH137]
MTDGIRRAAAGAGVVGGGGKGALVLVCMLVFALDAVLLWSERAFFLGSVRAHLPARAREPLCEGQTDRSDRELGATERVDSCHGAGRACAGGVLGQNTGIIAEEAAVSHASGAMDDSSARQNLHFV